MSSTPRCPPDPELKNIIDKLAQFVARNGPEFEQMTKTKQRENPKFSFLFGGEFYAYYNYKVHSEQARFRLQQQQDPHGGGFDGGYQGGGGPPPGHGYNGGGGSSWGGGPGSSDWGNRGGPPGGGYGGYNERNGGPGGYGNSGGFDRPGPGGGGPPPGGPRPLMDIPTYPPDGHKGHERHDSGGYDSYSGGGGGGPPFSQPPPAVSEPPPVNINGIKEQIKLLNEQQKTLKEQIAQSEQNLSAQHAVTTQQESQLVGETIKKAKRERLELLASDTGVDMEEMETVLHPLIESCTKDTISQGKSWIFSTATSHDRNQLIAHYLAFRVTQEDAPFNTKLHLIYLMNDVLHHCVRKNAEELKHSFESVAVEMFSAAAFSAVADKKPKLDKLIKLWEDKSIFSATTIKKMRDPETSWRAYQVQVREDHAKALEAAAAPFWTTYNNYKKQHTTFVNHANSSIQSIEGQKQTLEEQITRAEALQSVRSQPPPQKVVDEKTDWSKKAEAAVSVLSKGTSSMSSSSDDGSQGEAPKRPGRSSRWDTTPKDMPAQSAPSQAPPQGGPPQGWGEGPPPGFGGGPPPQGGFPPPGMGPAGMPMPDLSRPPPGFPPQMQKPVFDEQALIPTLPYFDLPAGLMVPMVKMEDSGYAHPIDPSKIRLPPPTPPSEKLLAALELFYSPPSHERPRDPEGWEVIGLYEWNREKSAAIKRKAEEIESGKRERSPTASPEPFTREHTPETEGKKEEKKEEEEKPKIKRYRSRSRTRSRSRDSTPDRRQRSRSPSPTGSYSMPSYLTKRSPSPRGRRERSRSRSRSSSPSPKRRRSPPSARRRRSVSPPGANYPGFGSSTPGPSSETRLDSSNKGHQMMQKMGWKGSGLGSEESGIVDPISGGEVRDKNEKFRGVGVRSDPFEAFRKAKSGSFYHRMKERDGKKK